MTVERAKMFGWTVVGGNGTLKKAALVDVLETLLNEIDRLEGAKNTEQLLQPDLETKGEK